MKERDIRVVFSMITGLLAEIAALFSGYSRGRHALRSSTSPPCVRGAELSARSAGRSEAEARVEQGAEGSEQRRAATM